MISDNQDANAPSAVTMLADPRGDLLEEMGMIAYLGRELGVRSKRFALLVEKGVVLHVAVDEGSIELSDTSAETLLNLDYFQARRESLAAAACQACAAELYRMSAIDAEAYLLLDSTRARLRSAFVSDSDIAEALAVVSSAAAAERARTAAEQAVAAQLFALDAVAAYRLLSSSSTLATLRGAGVPTREIDASLAIVYNAARELQPDLKPVTTPEEGGASGAFVAVLAVAAAGLVVAQQQGMLPPADLAAMPSIGMPTSSAELSNLVGT